MSINSIQIKQWREEHNTDPRYNDAQVQVFMDWYAEIQAAKVAETRYRTHLLKRYQERLESISLISLIVGLIGFMIVTFGGIDHIIDYILIGWSLQEFFILVMICGWGGLVGGYIIYIESYGSDM